MKNILFAIPFFAKSKKENRRETETESEGESKHETKFHTCLPASPEPDFNRWSEHIYKLINTKTH